MHMGKEIVLIGFVSLERWCFYNPSLSAVLASQTFLRFRIGAGTLSPLEETFDDEHHVDTISSNVMSCRVLRLRSNTSNSSSMIFTMALISFFERDLTRREGSRLNFTDESRTSQTNSVDPSKAYQRGLWDSGET